MIRFGSVCSGIEAASQAWMPLGWAPSFYSEIEDFPRAVLNHHHPEVPLHGDFTTIKAGQYDPIDLLVGGTPCQSFSIAGLRGGLGDDRGNLALEYLRLADRLRPRWLVWENVPGVLSSGKGRDFGSILGGMAELGYGVAYRVLDAQYVRTLPFPWAVPQRRRRVFVVGYLGDWRCAAAVLFDQQSMSGDPAPRREAGQNAAATLDASTGGCSWKDDPAGRVIAFNCKSERMGERSDGASPTLISMNGEKPNGGGQIAVAFAQNQRGELRVSDAAMAVTTGGGKPGEGYPAVAIQERAVAENPSSGPDGAGVSIEGSAYTLEARPTVQAVAFATADVSDPSAAGNAFSIMPMNSGKDYKARETDVAQPLMAGGPVGGNQGGDFIAHKWAVRRLTPRECERLQGFPDDFTNIPWRGKNGAPDGHRYKALGNSMAVNVMGWIGHRIQMIDGRRHAV